jgi:hypothetical protein
MITFCVLNIPEANTVLEALVCSVADVDWVVVAEVDVVVEVAVVVTEAGSLVTTASGIFVSLLQE